MFEKLKKYFEETPTQIILDDWNKTIDKDNINSKNITISEFQNYLLVLKNKISDIDLSIKVKNSCKENNIETIKDLLKFDSIQLLKMNFSKNSIFEINEFLLKNNLVIKIK